jgi:hypothetical protein
MQQVEYLELWMIRGFDDLTDLKPLRREPAITDLELVDMPQLRWEHVRPLQDHPTLQRLRLGTGSVRRNDELRSRLGYPDTEPPSGELLRLSRGGRVT